MLVLVSWATLKRDMAYLRDHLHAPIKYDPTLAATDRSPHDAVSGTNCRVFGSRQGI